MSATFTLSDGTTTITIYPKWDFKKKRKMDRSDHRMYDASMFTYRWAAYDVFEFSLEGITPAQAATINGWWENKTELTFAVSGSPVTTGGTVKISGNRTPFPKFLYPRVDYYQGKIELEATA